MNVTAKAGDIFTIERAQEGTLARAWAANDMVANMMTADTLNVIAQYMQQAAASAAQAEEFANNASDYAQNKFTFYKTASDPDGTIAGLAATTDGQSFWVAQGQMRFLLHGSIKTKQVWPYCRRSSRVQRP